MYPCLPGKITSYTRCNAQHARTPTRTGDNKIAHDTPEQLPLELLAIGKVTTHTRCNTHTFKIIIHHITHRNKCCLSSLLSGKVTPYTRCRVWFEDLPCQ